MSARRAMAEDTQKLEICNIPSKQQILTVQTRYFLVHNKAAHMAAKSRHSRVYQVRVQNSKKPKKGGFGLAMPGSHPHRCKTTPSCVPPAPTHHPQPGQDPGRQPGKFFRVGPSLVVEKRPETVAQGPAGAGFGFGFVLALAPGLALWSCSAWSQRHGVSTAPTTLPLPRVTLQ